MDISTSIKDYVCGVDIYHDYVGYKKILGNGLYNKVYTSTISVGRCIFDISSLACIKSLAEGREKEAGLAALVIGGSFIIDRVLKYSRKMVMHSKTAVKELDDI
jgi:hypothetical protein